MKYCTIEGCEKPSNYINPQVCPMHYKRAKTALHPFVATHHKHHGLSGTPEWNSWAGMIRRCHQVNFPKYPVYGGRGITVCGRWKEKPNGFLNFLEDMGKKPNLEYSLDRINVNGNYEPNNCRWATIHQQMSNMQASTTHVGVRLLKRKGRKPLWYAELKIDKKRVLSKYFSNFEDALHARREAEARYLNR